MASRLLVVDDHALVREGIMKLLSGQQEFDVVGEASSGFEAVKKASELGADVVLMDLYMPALDGIATTRLIKRELPNVEVVILTASSDEEDLFEAIQAGARGYVLKDTNFSVLVEQLKQVIAGGVGMTDDLTAKLVTGLARRTAQGVAASVPEREELTSREKDVLALIARGATNKEIASELFISENTVRAHVRTLMQKLRLENRTQLAVYGVREGYTISGSKGTPAASAR